MTSNRIFAVSLALFVLVATGLAVPPPVEPEESERDAPVSVEQNGLTVTASPLKPTFGRKESLAFIVTFKNTSEKAFRLYDTNFWIYHVNGGSWFCTMTTENGDRLAPTLAGKQRPAILRVPKPVLLDPGQSCTTVVSLFQQNLFVNLKDAPDLLAALTAQADPAVRRPLALEASGGASNAPRLPELPVGRATFHFTLKLLALNAPPVALTDPAAPPDRPDADKVPFYLGTIALPSIPFAIDDKDYCTDPYLEEKATLVVRGRVASYEQHANSPDATLTVIVREVLKDAGGAVQPGGTVVFRLPKELVRGSPSDIHYFTKDETGARRPMVPPALLPLLPPAPPDKLTE